MLTETTRQYLFAHGVEPDMLNPQMRIRNQYKPQPYPLTPSQVDRLMAYPKGLNTGIVTSVEAVTFTRKKRPVDCIKVIWRQGCTGTDRYFTEAQFRTILNV
jgi:hypothetical protein